MNISKNIQGYPVKNGGLMEIYLKFAENKAIGA